jgi:cardiolipin synthase
MKGTSGDAPVTSAWLTVPNLLSLLRILTIPVFVALIVDHDTSTAGLIVFAAVVATDWVDGWLARRTGQVSEIGTVLDPVADRLAIASGLIALVVRGVFPLWAALAILIRDAAILLVGAVLLGSRRVRIDVRFVGKLATLTLMVAIPLIAWGNLDLPGDEAIVVVGWVGYVTGVAEYYAAAALYVGDVRRALAGAG